ncbi:MAG: CAAX protease family protein [Actinobacteria bacterium 13_2_20CM_2_71_6]|nr:MAG: CAAX protease family protein [Actinobacteria bacterium 13_2_20CM_2_71_6]
MALVAAAVAVLVVANLLNNRFAVKWYVLTSVAATALLLLLYGLAGIPWALAGLGRRSVGRGALWGFVLVALVAAVYLAGALLPATRAVFRDRRVRGAGPGELAYQMLVRMPLGTVLLEEVAFRGVLYGLLRHLYGTGWATVVSSVLFGLWHVLPATGLVRQNPVAGRAFGGRRALVVPAAVLGAALAGVVLCEVQRRSGSLVAPLALHWATNALGYLTAFLVARVPRRPG